MSHLALIWADLSASERHRAGVLLRDGQHCVLERLGACRGGLQAHHVVPRQRLRIAFSAAPEWALELAVADSRNGLMLCEKHHGLHESKLEWDDMPDPEGLQAFAEQYGVQWSLARDFGAPYLAKMTGGPSGQVWLSGEPLEDSEA